MANWITDSDRIWWWLFSTDLGMWILWVLGISLLI